MGILDRFRTRGRLAAMVGVPIVFLVGFCVAGAWNGLQAYREAQAAQELGRVCLRVGDAVHELQKERGATAGFLASGGSAFGPEKTAAREKADEALRRLASAARESGLSAPAVAEKMRLAEARLADLAAWRRRADDRAVPVPEHLANYSGLIGALLGVVEEIPRGTRDLGLYTAAQTYLQLMRVKEDAGIERATLNSALTAGRFQEGLFQRFATLVGQQTAGLLTVRTLADPGQQAYLDTCLAGSFAAEVARYRALAFAGGALGGPGADPARWFSAATARIDALKAVEDRLGADLRTRVQAARAQAFQQLALAVGIMVLALGLSVVLAARFARDIVRPLAVCDAALQRLSAGDIPPRVEATFYGEFEEMRGNLNRCIDAVNALVRDAGMLSRAGVEGRLSARADVQGHQGDFRRIVQGVNDCLDAFLGPLDVAARYVDRISKGDVPPRITQDYPGDFAALRDSLNRCIDAVQALVEDAGTLSRAGVEGRLSVRADAQRHQGDFRRIVQGVNDCLDAVIGPLHVAAATVGRLSRGEIPPPITADYRGDFNDIKDNLNTCVASIALLVTEMERIIAAAREGRLQVRAEPGDLAGAYRGLLLGLNATLDAVVEPIQDVIRVVGALQGGDLTQRVEGAYLGDYRGLSEAMNQSIARLADTLQEIARASHTLAAASEELSTSAAVIAGNAEELLAQADRASAGVREASTGVKDLAGGVEAIREQADGVATGAEQVNSRLDSAGAAVEEMSVSLATVDGSVRRISEHMNAISDSTGTMTGAVDSVASAIREMEASLQAVAGNAASAAGIAAEATGAAETAAGQMARLGDHARQVGSVVDLIKGIADQTNLLALNATIEAASAGEAGRGFAVVAGEVKALAKQTAQATDEVGTRIAAIQESTDRAVQAIGDVVRVIERIAGISGSIASAVEEQHTSTAVIARNVGQAAGSAGQVARSVTDVAEGARAVSHNLREVTLGAQELSRNLQDAVLGVRGIAGRMRALAGGTASMATSGQGASAAVADVAGSVGVVRSSSQASARGVAEIRNASNDLARLAETLRASVSRFRLEGA